MSNEIPHNPLEGPKPDLVVNVHDNSDEQISIIVVSMWLIRQIRRIV